MLPCYYPPRPTPANVPNGTRWLRIGRLRDGRKVFQPAESKKEFFKTERTGNFYENKGPLWKKQERSWNSLENKALTGYMRECY
jgi:hypothetical protein